MVSIPTMGRVSMAFFFNMMLIKYTSYCIDRTSYCIDRSDNVHFPNAIPWNNCGTKLLFYCRARLKSLMVFSTMADSTNHGSHQLQVHNRRLLENPAATPLPPFKSASICGGLGPVCPGGMHIECAVGGVVGCICTLVRTCQPSVSGCTLFHGASKTPCGF